MHIMFICLFSSSSSLPLQSYINCKTLISPLFLLCLSVFVVAAVVALFFFFSRPVGCLMINWMAGLRL